MLRITQKGSKTIEAGDTGFNVSASQSGMTWHALLLLYTASNRRVSGAWGLVLKGNPTFFVGDQIDHQKLMCSTRGVVLSPLALRLGRLWRRPLGYLRRLTNSVGGRRSYTRAGRRIGIRRNIPPTRNFLDIMLTRVMRTLCKRFHLGPRAPYKPITEHGQRFHGEAYSVSLTVLYLLHLTVIPSILVVP